MQIMKFDATFLRSKVARRIFLLFIVCALLPITALAIISFIQVTEQINEQSQRRLRQASKAVAMSIYERLMFLDADMKMVASNLYTGSGAPFNLPPEGLTEELKQRFKTLAPIGEAGKSVPFLGRIEDPPEPTPAEKRHMSSGKAVVSVQQRQDLPLGIIMSRALDPQHPERGILLGEINPTYLWGLGDQDTLPPLTELCVLDRSYKVLICSLPGATSFAAQIGLHVSESSSGRFEWSHQDKEYLGSYWSLPLKFNFFVPQWTVVLFESKADILAPMVHFKRIFPLVIILFLGLVLLLSLRQIRRILVPLEKLQEGTRRIAVRDFVSRVAVSSGDEFEELANSFNIMADRLDRQFNTLATMADIDRAILSVLDTEKIVRTVLNRMRDVLLCDAIAVTVIDSDDRGRAYISEEGRRSEIALERVALTPRDIEKLHENRQSLFISPNQSVPDYLAPLAWRGSSSFLNLPIFFNESLRAIISLGYVDPPLLNEETLLHARQIADQVAIGISNAQLYQQIGQQAVDLERANKVKDEFLGVMSHELRTPLTVIEGYTGMILDGGYGEVNQEQARALEHVMSRTNDLVVLVSSILEATRIATGAVRVVSEEIDLRHFLEELKLGYNLPLKKEIAIVWDYPADLPVLKTDGGKLKQILDNLISNAIKFTDKGNVTVSARHFPWGMEFKVSDTGIGIPAETLPLIFEKFRQVDSSNVRPYEGVGLGLYIVEKFTDLLRGKIEVKSEPGKGSTFSVTIPKS